MHTNIGHVRHNLTATSPISNPVKPSTRLRQNFHVLYNASAKRVFGATLKRNILIKCQYYQDKNVRLCL